MGCVGSAALPAGQRADCWAAAKACRAQLTQYHAPLVRMRHFQDSMILRWQNSRTRLTELWEWAIGAGEELWVVRHLARGSAKALEGVAECDKATGEQLALYAKMIDMALAEGDAALVLGLATEEAPHVRKLLTLLPVPSRRLTLPPLFLSLPRLPALDPSPLLWICSELPAPGVCVNGRGLQGFVRGQGTGAIYQNQVCVHAVDAQGQRYDGLQPEDMSVCVDASSSVSVRAGREAGSVLATFTLPFSCTQTSLALSLFDVSLPSSPWPLQVLPEFPSAILGAHKAELPPNIHNRFRFWLSCTPDTTFALLYRGSRDGMTPAAFHTHCDGQGPTLTLIEAEDGRVFGGYTEGRWESGLRHNVPGPGSFLFSVIGPLGSSPSRFSLLPGKTPVALLCSSLHGPCFGSTGSDLALGARGHNDAFDVLHCHSHMGTTYNGQGYELATAAHFVPTEVEMFLVLPP